MPCGWELFAKLYQFGVCQSEAVVFEAVVFEAMVFVAMVFAHSGGSLLLFFWHSYNRFMELYKG